MKLRSGVGLIPGGLQYCDPLTASRCWQDDHTFMAERVQQVISFRAQNPQIYTDPQWLDSKFVTQQIMDYNALRLDNNKNYFFDGVNAINVGNPKPAAIPPPTKLCECGTQLVPHYCVTCGGNKIDRWDCPSCKKTY